MADNVSVVFSAQIGQPVSPARDAFVFGRPARINPVLKTSQTR